MSEQSLHRTKRDYGLFVSTGIQGVGKSHENLRMAYGYLLDNPLTGRQGKKVLVMNGGKDKMWKNVRPMRYGDIKNQPDRSIYQLLPLHSNGDDFSDDDCKRWFLYTLKNFSDGLLIIDDLKAWIGDTSSNEFVKPITILRHKKQDMYSDSGTDCLLSMQDMRMVTSTMWDQLSYYRFHHVNTTVASQQNDMANPELYKIAENIVNRQFYNAEDGYSTGALTEQDWRKYRSFHVWVSNKQNKIMRCKQDNFMRGAIEVILDRHQGGISTYCNRNGLDVRKKEHQDQALQVLLSPLMHYYKEDMMPPWQLNPSN